MGTVRSAPPLKTPERCALPPSPFFWDLSLGFLPGIMMVFQGLAVPLFLLLFVLFCLLGVGTSLEAACQAHPTLASQCFLFLLGSQGLAGLLVRLAHFPFSGEQVGERWLGLCEHSQGPAVCALDAGR